MNNNRTKLYKYAELVLKAKLDCNAKALLWFYAYTYNWDKGLPSYWPQRKICALVGMSTSTYRDKRIYLENLGWINVKNRGWKLPCKVRVLIGQDDPEYDSRSWAEWHPSNKKKIEDSEGDLENGSEFSLTIEKQLQELDSVQVIESKQDDSESAVDSKRVAGLMDWFG